MAKAKIEEVFAAFQRFQVEMTQAAGRARQPGDLKGALKAAQKNLKLRMEELGLAEHIDWERLDG